MRLGFADGVDCEKTLRVNEEDSRRQANKSRLLRGELS